MKRSNIRQFVDQNKLGFGGYMWEINKIRANFKGRNYVKI